MVADARDAVGDRNRGQAFTIVERPVADARDAVRDYDRCQL